MKKITKVIVVLLIMCMCSTCVFAEELPSNESEQNDIGSNTIQSEVEEPMLLEASPENIIYLDKPVITNISVNGTSVTLSFDSVKDATHYVVKNENTGTESKISAGNNSFTATGLNENTTYSFKVKAVYEADGNSSSSDWSDAKSAAISITVPSKPALSSEPYNKGIILSWNNVSGATSYEVWRYYNKKWSKIKTTTATSYKNTGLTIGKKYTYKVRALRTVTSKTVAGAYSNSKSITAKRYLTGTIRLGYSSGVLIRNAYKYKEGSSTKVISKTLLKKGTRVTILKRATVKGKGMDYVKLSNGKKYWIKRGNISYGAPYSTYDYTTQAKENFVNKQGYSSKTKYLLFICHYAQKTYVFKGKKGNWKLHKTFKCVTGKASTRTPRGVFKLYKKSRLGWCYQYVSYFKSRNSFHSRPYGTKVMGRPASNGCIRLYDNDAKYIYKSIPKGTTVVSY